MKLGKKWLPRVGLLLVCIAVVALVWVMLRPSAIGREFAAANGRIEATEVDVATKLPGRVASINVDEGDFVKSGEVVARMDTQVLEAQLAQAQAEVRRAQNAKSTAESLVAQRTSEKATAEAVVAQRQAELTAAEKRFSRTEQLVKRNALPQQQLDDDRAVMQSAQAALAASRSQVVSAQAGIAAARSQVIEAQSAIEAATASTVRLQADIDDSLLKAPRSGRVQYRVAQPGEVLRRRQVAGYGRLGRRLHDLLSSLGPGRQGRARPGSALGDRRVTAVRDSGQGVLRGQRCAIHPQDRGDC